MQALAHQPAPSTPSWPVLATIGGVGGAVGALLGGGTGAITIPTLDRLTTLRRAVIHGTVASPNAVVAIVGATAYWLRGGAVALDVAIPMMLGGVLGVMVGVRILAHLSDMTLRLAFISVLILVGVKFLSDGQGLTDLAGWNMWGTAVSMTGPSLWTLALVFGIVVGAWCAALGLGGGLLTVPTLVIVLDVQMQTALGTCLLVMLPNALLSVISHHRRRTSDPAAGCKLAVGAAPGAIVGVLVTLAIPSVLLSIIFGGFATVMAATETRRLIRRRRAT